MMKTKEDYLKILQTHDDAQSAEEPLKFDRPAAEKHFLDFASDLMKTWLKQKDYCELEISTGSNIQDTSFHGQIIFPQYIMKKDYPLKAKLIPIQDNHLFILRVSNWGEMATVSHDEAIENDSLLLIQEVLRNFDYIYIPSLALDTPYIGKNLGVTGIKTWWIRYFDWI